MNMKQTIYDKLDEEFHPQYLDVADESHMHNVPVGSESHFKVTLVSDEFRNQKLIMRHRMVNMVLEDEMQKIHALALHTMTSEEWFEKSGKVVDSPLCQGGGKNQ